jgi:phosphoribosyl-AMP cyclohydrolase
MCGGGVSVRAISVSERSTRRKVNVPPTGRQYTSPNGDFQSRRPNLSPLWDTAAPWPRHTEESRTVPNAVPPSNPKSNLGADIAARLRRDQAGLVPAIVQEHVTGEVLMLAWMDEEALHRTLTTGRATYWSRSRQEYWVKGATSGHYQYVRAVALDCDGDAVLLTVEQVGPACHTGSHSCFTDELGLSEEHTP